MNGCLRPLVSTFSDPSPKFAIIVLSVPVIACGCLIILLCMQKCYDRSSSQRRRQRRRQERSNLRQYPGSQDIVLSPTTNTAEGDGTTVRALLEREDNHDFDEMVPITTIQVRMDSV